MSKDDVARRGAHRNRHIYLFPAGKTDQAACRVRLSGTNRERQTVPHLAPHQRLRSLLDELRANITELG